MTKVIRGKAQSVSRINNSMILKGSSRRQPSLKLYKENQMLVKRLQNQNSIYRFSDFGEGVREHEELLNRISEYPYRVTRNKSFYKSVSRKKGVKDEIVFMRAAFISKKKFDIEIYKSGKKMTILAFDNDEAHKLCLAWVEALKVMESSLNYDKIIEKLRYENDELVLVEE